MLKPFRYFSSGYKLQSPENLFYPEFHPTQDILLHCHIGNRMTSCTHIAFLCSTILQLEHMGSLILLTGQMLQHNTQGNFFFNLLFFLLWHVSFSTGVPYISSLIFRLDPSVLSKEYTRSTDPSLVRRMRGWILYKIFLCTCFPSLLAHFCYLVLACKESTFYEYSGRARFCFLLVFLQ